MLNYATIFCLLMSNDIKVNFYPYRTAAITHPIGFDDRDDEACELQRLLAKKAGQPQAGMGNHVVYEIVFPDDMAFAIRFSDFTVYTGIGVTKARY